MNTFKSLIKIIFNKFNYDIQKKSVTAKSKELRAKVQFYYKEFFLSRDKENMEDHELLQFLELRFGGPALGVKRNSVSPHDPRTKKQIETGGMLGGDRMNVFYHDYAIEYSKYLKQFRETNRKLNIVEIGILKGTGLAIWDDYFKNHQIYGLDIDFSNYKTNLAFLKKKGAFKKQEPKLVDYDQFSDNSKTLRQIFKDKKVDIVIDDGFHSDTTILNSFKEFYHLLNDEFVYFIEDNSTAYIKLQKIYPNLEIYYNNELTVVTNNKF